MEITRYLERCQKRVNNSLGKLLPNPNKEPRELNQAMRYAVLNGGKRLRAALVYATGEALNANIKILDHVSAAVEMIHAFSLVHDDLPALDNDDLRRGKPSCHKAFNEGTAILAGDGLQALGIETLARLNKKMLPPDVTLHMVNLLTHTVGPDGLVGGQALDIAMPNQQITVKELAYCYQLKTGQFLTTCILLGALTAKCKKKNILNNLKKFGDHLGLAFQIHDDIIGIETDTKKLGKTQDSDAARNKPTYPSLIGIAEAKKQKDIIFSKAMTYLQKSGIRTEKLTAIATYIAERDF